MQIDAFSRTQIVSRYQESRPTQNELPQLAYEHRSRVILEQGGPLVSGTSLAFMAPDPPGYRFLDQLDRFDGDTYGQITSQIETENQTLTPAAKNDRKVGGAVWLAGAAGALNAFAGVLPGPAWAWGVAGAAGLLVGGHLFTRGDEALTTVSRNELLLEDLKTLAG